MTQSQLVSHVDTEKITRDQLALIPTPVGTDSHKPVPHHEIVQALADTLAFRHISIFRDEYAVSKDGAKMFGLIELETGFTGARFALGIRNSHDKSMRLAMTVGYRVFVCDNMAFHGDFQPVLAKHSKHFNLLDSISIGVDHMQRSFAPMVEQVETWRGSRIADETAKLIIYRAFVEKALDVPHRLEREVHNLYFNPTAEEFQPRTLWSLSNAFTGALKQLEPIPQFKATAEVGEFLREYTTITFPKEKLA
jgi:hypothetical protein